MIEIQDTSLDQNFFRDMLLKNTKTILLSNTTIELRKQIDILDGNEELVEISKHLFEDGFSRISSENPRDRKQIVWVLFHSFQDLTLVFKEYLQVEGEFDGNVYDYVKQIIRYFDFIKRLENLDEEDTRRNVLIYYLKEITEYIFNKPSYFKPQMPKGNDVDQAEIKYLKRLNVDRWQNAFYALKYSKGYETYYAAGLIEIIRTMSNQRRHPYAYRENFVESLDFYYNYSQMISVYNLAIYSFIELLEAWISVKPFLEKHMLCSR